MNLTCIMVDDEYLATKILQEYAIRIEGLKVEMTFTRPEQALDYLKSHSVDLLFLDIQMPKLSGFELMKKLSTPPMIVFTTARHDYAVQAYDLDVLDYLVKPISFDRFEKAMRKAMEFSEFKKIRSSNTSGGYLMIKADYRIHKIVNDEIEFIEGLSEYVKIHTHEKTYIPLVALKDLAQQLPNAQFVRIHKSYIVSLSQVTSYNHQAVLLKNGKTLPIGRSYKADFLRRMDLTAR